MTREADDPLRFVAVVVGVLAVFFLALVVAVPLGGDSAGAVLTVPLVFAVPIVFAAVYYYVRDR